MFAASTANTSERIQQTRYQRITPARFLNLGHHFGKRFPQANGRHYHKKRYYFKKPLAMNFTKVEFHKDLEGSFHREGMSICFQAT